MSGDLDRLYKLLPTYIRLRDAESGEPLRGLLRVINEQADVVENNISQLYENWFIETCEDWVVPYIADLVGEGAIHEAGEPGAIDTAEGALRNRFLIPRRQMANTIANRRRKGTLALLDALSAEAAGWPGFAVEVYRLLSVTQNINNLRLTRGRVADVRRGDTLDLVGGPFDTLAHTVDLRRPNSARTTSRWAARAVLLFAWRQNAYPIHHAPAFCRFQRTKVGHDHNKFTFSPLGNDTLLYARPIMPPDASALTDERNLPVPIRRRAFAQRTADYYGPGKSLLIWRDGFPVPLADIIPADLTHWKYYPKGDAVAVDPRLGRIVFGREYPPRDVRVSYYYGFTAPIGGGGYPRPLTGKTVYTVPPDAADPTSKFDDILTQWQESGGPDAIVEFSDDGAYPPQDQGTHYTQVGPILARVAKEFGSVPPLRYRVGAHCRFKSVHNALDAWKADHTPDAYIELLDSGIYEETLSIHLPAGKRLWLRASDGERPVIRLSPPANAEDSAFLLTAAAPAPPESPASRLTLDGLLITGWMVDVKGQLGDLIIQDCTLVPGLALAPDCDPEFHEQPSLRLRHTSAHVAIARSILGPIEIEQGPDDEPVPIELADSVLDAPKDPKRPDARSKLRVAVRGNCAGAIAHAELKIRRCTVFGEVHVHAITLAENSIFADLVFVARRQSGCMRFCAVTPDSRTPRRYECEPDQALANLSPNGSEAQREAIRRRVRPRFASQRYGTPVYARLADDCASEILRGADDESEMGAYHDLFEPQRQANLRARIDEYTPAGTDAGLFLPIGDEHDS